MDGNRHIISSAGGPSVPLPAGSFSASKPTYLPNSNTNNGASVSSCPFPHHLAASTTAATTSTLGLLHETLLPSLNLHATLSLVAYTAGRLTHRVEAKDYLWPTGLVANAWFNALVPSSSSSSTSHNHVVTGSLRSLSSLSWTQKLLLCGITAWGSRLLYRIASRSIRRGRDDPRYTDFSSDKHFWGRAWFSVFLPEAVFQSLIGLAWAIPLSVVVSSGPSSSAAAAASTALTTMGLHDTGKEWSAFLHSLAVGIFSAGFALEVLADWQVETGHRSEEERKGLVREGVWSIVRHPNYLGDFLIHASIPLLLYSDALFHPLTLVGPLSNYIFLRHIGGDRENETAQEGRYKLHNHRKLRQLREYRGMKNSFWPGVKELGNPWTWVVVSLGVLGVGVERVGRRWMA